MGETADFYSSYRGEKRRVFCAKLWATFSLPSFVIGKKNSVALKRLNGDLLGPTWLDVPSFHGANVWIKKMEDPGMAAEKLDSNGTLLYLY
ncbi:hypothetical protein KM043_014061 [Ampulex compressa]|nr:hypothetical protein KM043_014061 [Ampulex compressa]